MTLPSLRAWLYADQLITFSERVSTVALSRDEITQMVKTTLWGKAVFWANEHGYDVNGTRDDQTYRSYPDSEWPSVYVVEVIVRFSPRTQGQWGHIREQMVALHNDPPIHQDWPFADDGNGY